MPTDRKAYAAAWYRKHTDWFRQYEQRPEVVHRRQRQRQEWKAGRGALATEMGRQLYREILNGTFPRAKTQKCAEQDATCCGRMEYYFIAYDRWNNVVPLCCSHHRRRDRANPKT